MLFSLHKFHSDDVGAAEGLELKCTRTELPLAARSSYRLSGVLVYICLQCRIYVWTWIRRQTNAGRQPISWSTVFEKLRIAQLLKKCPAFYETRRLIVVVWYRKKKYMHTQEHTCIWAQHCRILIKSATLIDVLSIKWNKLTLILSVFSDFGDKIFRKWRWIIGLRDTEYNIDTTPVSVLGNGDTLIINLNLSSYDISVMKHWFLWSGHVASMVWMRNSYNIFDRRTPGEGTSETGNRWKDNINKIDMKWISTVFPLV